MPTTKKTPGQFNKTAKPISDGTKKTTSQVITTKLADQTPTFVPLVSIPSKNIPISPALSEYQIAITELNQVAVQPMATRPFQTVKSDELSSLAGAGRTQLPSCD